MVASYQQSTACYSLPGGMPTAAGQQSSGSTPADSQLGVKSACCVCCVFACVLSVAECARVRARVRACQVSACYQTAPTALTTRQPPPASTNRTMTPRQARPPTHKTLSSNHPTPSPPSHQHERHRPDEQARMPCSHTIFSHSFFLLGLPGVSGRPCATVSSMSCPLRAVLTVTACTGLPLPTTPAAPAAAALRCLWIE